MAYAHMSNCATVTDIEREEFDRMTIAEVQELRQELLSLSYEALKLHRKSFVGSDYLVCCVIRTLDRVDRMIEERLIAAV